VAWDANQQEPAQSQNPVLPGTDINRASATHPMGALPAVVSLL
jgi:hypothetical protein